MPQYAYTARDATGKQVEGTLSADSSALAVGKLRELGFHPEKVRAIEVPRAEQSRTNVVKENVFLPVANGVPLKDLAQFYRQFAVLINAGIPLYQSIVTLQSQTKNPRIVEILHDCQRHVNDGGKLSDVFQRHRVVFSDIQIEMIRASETGGMLDQMLNRLADYLEQEIKLRQMISRLTFYPKMVALLGFLLLGSRFFIDATPAISKLVLGGMGKMTYSGVDYLMDTVVFLIGLFSIGFVVSAVSKLYFYHNEDAHLRWEQFKFGLPGVGKVSKMFAVSKFGRAFGAMYAGGLPMNQAIRVAGNASGSKIIGIASKRAMMAAERGAPISQAFRETGVFPPVVIDMLHTGEQTGNIDTMMTKVAEYLEGEAETKAHMYSHMFAAFLGLLVGIMVAIAVIRFYGQIGAGVQSSINEAGG